jgi:hypothetical protein
MPRVRPPIPAPTIITFGFFKLASSSSVNGGLGLAVGAKTEGPSTGSGGAISGTDICADLQMMSDEVYRVDDNGNGVMMRMIEMKKKKKIERKESGHKMLCCSTKRLSSLVSLSTS